MTSESNRQDLVRALGYAVLTALGAPQGLARIGHNSQISYATLDSLAATSSSKYG